MTGESRPSPPGVGTDLDMIASGIEALNDLASDPDKAQDSARVYDFSIRWGVLMSGRLRRLEHYYRAGELAENHESRYREVRCRLKDAAPLIERLGIGHPNVPLGD